MLILRAFKTELDLNNAQKTACIRHAGAARWAYNWGLVRKIEAYQEGKRVPTAIDLHRELNVLKKGELSWMYTVSKCAPQEALRNLDQAYTHFFRRVKEKRAGRIVQAGFPRFKSKKNGSGSFRLTGAIHIFENAIQLPRLGRLRLKEHGYLPIEGAHILSATVSERAGRWFVSVQVEMCHPEPLETTRPVAGVDLGILALATMSDGTRIENPRALTKSLHRIQRLQRIVSRRQRGSANREKAVRKLARAHLPRRQCPQEHPASGHQPAGEDQVSSCPGRPERERDAAEPSPGTGNCRCGFSRIQAADAVQREVVWLYRHPGSPLLPIYETLFEVWACQSRNELEPSRLQL